MRAGMPHSVVPPAASAPGQVIVTLIGSSRQCPSSSPSNPCHAALGVSVQQAGSVDSDSTSASSNGTDAPVRGSVTEGGCQTPKNQSGRLSLSRMRVASRTIACRKRIASTIASPARNGPDGPSNIAAATSSEAIIGESGEVLACIRNVSLSRVWSTGARGDERTCSIADCDSAASSLWVDCVLNTVGRAGSGWLLESSALPYRCAFCGWYRAYANLASS